MSRLLVDILTMCLIGYMLFDIVEDLYFKKSLAKKEPDKAVPDSPGEEIKLEAELVEQILKGTAELDLSYNRSDGTFTAELTFVDPIDGNTYHYTNNSSSVNSCINAVVSDYVHLLESQESPYGIKFR